MTVVEWKLVTAVELVRIEEVFFISVIDISYVLVWKFLPTDFRTVPKVPRKALVRGFHQKLN